MTLQGFIDLWKCEYLGIHQEPEDTRSHLFGRFGVCPICGRNVGKSVFSDANDRWKEAGHHETLEDVKIRQEREKRLGQTDHELLKKYAG